VPPVISSSEGVDLIKPTINQTGFYYLRVIVNWLNFIWNVCVCFFLLQLLLLFCFSISFSGENWISIGIAPIEELLEGSMEDSLEGSLEALWGSDETTGRQLIDSDAPPWKQLQQQQEKEKESSFGFE